MNMPAAENKERAQRLAATFRAVAEQRAAELTPFSKGFMQVQTRDIFADAIAELAELIASLDFRQMT